MTLANQITLARGFLGLLTFACLWVRGPRAYALALALCLAATATDWIDGWVARRTRSVSPFGAMADPIADKVLVIGALIAFLRIRSLDVPHWAVFLIIVRDLVVGGLRTLAGAQGKLLAAERWGKWKMGVQSGCVLAILAYLVAKETLGWSLPPWTRRVPAQLVVCSLLVTWASAALYLRQNLQLLRKSWNLPTS